MRAALLAVTTFTLAACAVQQADHATGSPGASTPALRQLHADADAVSAVATQPAAKEFLRAVRVLPPQSPRVVYTDKKKRHSVTPEHYAQMKEEERAAYERMKHDEAFYYATYYGTPVAYVRAVDLAAQHGIGTLNGLRVLDIGYGAIGGMRLLAGAGAKVSAVDVDSLLPALYREREDQGIVNGIDGRVGSITLYNGVFGGNASLTRAIGRDFDLIITKNTMKRGYMKPQNDRKALVDFGVSDATLLGALYDALSPGGLLVIYNLSGAYNPERPATDGRSPFDRSVLESAGFSVIALDASDDEAARRMGTALGWEKQMGDLSKNLFSHHTILRKMR